MVIYTTRTETRHKDWQVLHGDTLNEFATKAGGRGSI